MVIIWIARQEIEWRDVYQQHHKNNNHEEI